ncbi:MAG: hypothetical protein A2133_09880 [Actinobacteria bacterium RBG_16_64_13]|nr:MAG: hypothetical protein A2133_09880 [Actinobacteria bacterium RBG_16_64_13]
MSPSLRLVSRQLLRLMIILTVNCLIRGGVAIAATPSEESALLISHLGLPDSTSVSVASIPRLPAVDSMRVYLGFGMDMGVRNNFGSWINNWNARDAKKYGTIVLVEEIADADLVFARFVVREQTEKHVGTNSYVVPTRSTETTSGGVFGGGGYATGNAQTTTTGSRVVTDTYSFVTVPVYAYMLTRGPSGLEVIWRYASEVLLQETNMSGRQLFEDFKTLAKARRRPKSK